MNKTSKRIILWLVILGSAFLLWQVVKTNPRDKNVAEISYSHFLLQVADGQVTKVVIASNVVRGYDDKGNRFKVFAPANQSAMLDALQQHDVDIWFDELPEPTWGTWLMNLAPLALLAGLWFFMIRGLRGVGKQRSAPQIPPSGGSSEDAQPGFDP
jgi:cell division protease FtsH